MKKNKTLLVGVCVFLFIFALGVNLVSAQVDVGLEYAEDTGLGNEDPRVVVAKVIRVIFGFLGIIAVGLIMYAGWLWMSSQGNEEQIEQAKKILKNSVIGLVIILSAFAITSFIIGKLLDITGSGGGGGAGGGVSGGFSALGNGIIESHYPARDQKDVPRNTKIAVTFKEAVDPSSIITDGKINSENIRIYKSNDGDGENNIIDVSAYKTDDNKIYVFKPAEYLGSPSEFIWYSIALSKDIKKANGQSAFSGVAGEIAYEWSFEVGTTIDVTPPVIEDVIPLPADTEPRNVVIQINFSEAVDPIAASGGTLAGFDNIVIGNKTDNDIVDGNFYISNQYKTVEFLTEDACGVNSCGNTVYCLPGDKELSTLIKAATFNSDAGGVIFPYDGIVDMADNSLDGNGSGAAQGPESQSGLPPFDENNPSAETQGDDYQWFFSTSDEIDLEGPKIFSINPNIGENGVGLDVVPEAVFNKFLMSSSLTTDSSNIYSSSGEINYWISKDNDKENKRTSIFMNHDQFNENLEYYPQVFSAVKDIYQNCYSPCSGVNASGGEVIGTPSCCDGVPSAAETCY